MSGLVSSLEPGDMVYAAVDMFNDGSHPEVAEEERIVEKGWRGVIVNVGHLEDQPEKEVFLVRFENADKELGPPVGCYADELMVKE